MDEMASGEGEGETRNVNRKVSPDFIPTDRSMGHGRKMVTGRHLQGEHSRSFSSAWAGLQPPRSCIL